MIQKDIVAKYIKMQEEESVEGKDDKLNVDEEENTL